MINLYTYINKDYITVIAALELAYFKGSGELIKFSEQEMTDCYNNGCEGGDFKMVSFLVFSSLASDKWNCLVANPFRQTNRIVNSLNT